MISIYTDMGRKDDKVAIAYVILTDADYICADSVLIENKSSTDIGELCAMYHALLKLKTLKPEEDVTLYSDNSNAVRMLYKRACHKSVYVKQLLQLAKEYNVQFVNIKGHSSIINPNSLVNNMCTTRLKGGAVYDTC